MASDNRWSVRAIADRIEREKQQAINAECVTKDIAATGNPVLGWWSCHADPGELAAAQAHTAMQSHLECGVDRCRVRRRARDSLVAAGRMVLDPRATRPRAIARTSWFALLRIAVFGCGAVFVGGRHAM